jgi:NTE family protein
MAGAWRGISAGGTGDLLDLASDDGTPDFTRSGVAAVNRRVTIASARLRSPAVGCTREVMDRRALVLGGGGVTGIAWEIGVIAGLADRGIDLAAADVIIGTSAGSVVGADITSGQEPEALYQAQLAPPDPEPAARIGWGPIGRLLWVMNTSRDPVRARARIGRWALAARTMPEADRRKVFEARLPVSGWPATMLKVTAVDARTGEFVVFDSSGEEGLVDAVGASCAVPGVWPPVTIDRSATRAIGRNVLDVSRRAAAATAGRAQAAAEAAAVRTVWQADGGSAAS